MRHRSEVAIYRITHTSCVDELLDVFLRTTRPPKTRWPTLNTLPGNLCEYTLKQLAHSGGLILVLDNKKLLRCINPLRGTHGFSKSKTGIARNGISACGVYDGSKHSIETVIKAALKGQYAHAGHPKDHLWQVYWQKTYLNPFSSTGIERGTKKEFSISETTKNGKTVTNVHCGTHRAIDYMINILKGGDAHKDFVVQKAVKEGKIFKKEVSPEVRLSAWDRERPLPNIWSYDFVNTKNNREIININHATTASEWHWKSSR